MSFRTVALKHRAWVVAGQSPDGSTVHPIEDRIDGVPFIQGNAEFGERFPAPRLVAEAPPRVAPQGSILLSVRAPVGALNIAKEDVAIGRGLNALVPRFGCDAAFLWWAMHALVPELGARAVGSTYDAVAADDIRTLPLPSVDGAARSRIADFLDRESERIEALIELKEALVARGREAFAAELDEVVGRHAYAALPLTSAVDVHRPIMYGIVLPGEDVSDGHLLVKGGNVERRNLHAASLARVAPEVERPYARARLKGGDVLVTIRGGFGATALVAEELTGANITQDTARVGPRRGVEGRWLAYALRSSQAQAQIARVATGAGVKGVNIRDLKRVRIPLPDKAVQASESDLLDERAREFDRLQTKLEVLSERLVEYRHALITEAVIGQLDVTRVSQQQMEERARAAMEGEPLEAVR